MGLNLIMLGPPGAGKGTQAARLAQQRGIPKISTGDILRESIRQGLPAGAVAKAKIDRGELVDDHIMVEIVRNRLAQSDTSSGFVLDGFPRTVGQASALDRIMEERGNGPLIVVDIVVPQAELVRRLATRRICERCGTTADPFAAGDACTRCDGQLVQRSDDDEQVVLERLKIYEKATKPLVEFYRERPRFRVVNGAQPPERVAHEIDTVIDDAASMAEVRA